jgi:hypothetical protein
VGGYANGVLGCETDTGEITLIQGWNWYAGSDPTAVGSGQYDFETVLIHELGHALGLGHSASPASVMYATLAAGTANRVLAASDLNVPDTDDGACGLHAAPVTPRPIASAASPGLAGSSWTGPAMASPGGAWTTMPADLIPGIAAPGGHSKPSMGRRLRGRHARPTVVYTHIAARSRTPVPEIESRAVDALFVDPALIGNLDGTLAAPGRARRHAIAATTPGGRAPAEES